eukprot:71931-Rhodomonas_salina.1
MLQKVHQLFNLVKVKEDERLSNEGKPKRLKPVIQQYDEGAGCVFKDRNSWDGANELLPLLWTAALPHSRWQSQVRDPPSDHSELDAIPPGRGYSD